MVTIAPQIVGTPTYGESNGSVLTTLTIPKPSGLQDGDILVAALRCGSSSQATDYALAGWTRRSYTFAGSSATSRVTGFYTHYVATASSEPSSYVFALSGNAFARQAGMIFIVRPGTGADPWGSEPSYTVASTFAGGPPPYAPTSPLTITANSLVLYGGANETTSPSTTSWTPPSGSTSIGVRGSLTNQSDTSATRSVVAAAFEIVAGTSAGGSGKTVVFPAYSSPVSMLFAIPGTEETVDPTPIGIEILNHEGNPAYLSYLDGSSERLAPGHISIWLPGFNDVESLLARSDTPTVAHRGGSSNWPEYSEYAYDHSVRRGYSVLEFSCGWTSDLVPFGLGAQYLDAAAGVGGSIDPTSMTWTTLNSTYQNKLRPVSPGVFQPFYRLEEMLEKYVPTHIICVDPKFGFSNQTKIDKLLDICDVLGGPDKIIIKFDSSETDAKLTTSAALRGYERMNYWGTDTTAMAAQQSRWTLIGALYSDGAAMTAANSYSKPSWGAIIPNQAGYASAKSNGADLAMCSDVLNIAPVSAWN